MTPKTILLATDLSCRCDRALDRAAMLAAAWKGKLVVAHVLAEPPDASRLPSWRRPLDPRRAALQRIGLDLLGKRGFELEVIVERGDPASAILKSAESSGCGLIITGVARDETLGRSLLGTTVEKLARLAEVPVLVVKSRPRGPYGNVVVGTDFSKSSRRAFETALAWMPEAHFSLFHAYDVPFEGIVDNQREAREAAESRAFAESREFLAATPAAAASGKSIRVFCEYGPPEELLPEMAQAKGFDLAALGSKGRSQVANVLLGSVAHRLLQRLETDVLLALSPRRRTPSSPSPRAAP